MKKKLLIGLVLLFSFNLFSQIVIKGVVQNSSGIPLPLVNVSLLSKQESLLLQYKQTNQQGGFEFVIKNNTISTVLLKVSCLGYKSVSVETSINTHLVVEKNIILEEDVSELKEVAVRANFRDVTDKNDTITYNLKKLLNGSEQKLKDIIEKLPGLSIDTNGKINYKGKKIDDFLIEGDEFYGNQHQLATENMKSEMVDKIEVLKNFKNLSSIDGFGNQTRTALNISLKEGYKNVMKGDVELASGFRNKYRQHNNLYNFGSGIKINILSDVNNTNNQSLSVSDYLSLNKGIGKEIVSESNSIEVNNDLPSFLFSEDDVNKKRIQFYSINFSNRISKKTKIQGFSYWNRMSQNEFRDTKQTFFLNQNFEVYKKSEVLGNSLFSNNKIQIESKINASNYLNYIFSLNLNNDSQGSQIQNQSPLDVVVFDEKKRNRNFNIGNLFTHKIKINNHYLIEYSLYDDFTSFDKALELISNKSFLNINFNNNFSVQQETNNYINKFGLFSKLVAKKEAGTVNVKIGSSVTNESFSVKLDEKNPEFNSNVNLLNTNNYLDVGFNKKKSKWINYLLGMRLLQSQFQSQIDKTDNLSVLPYINLSLQINEKTNIALAYKKDLGNTSSSIATKSKFLEDYRSISSNTKNMYGAILPINIFSINASHVNFNSNFITFLGLIYTNKTKNIGYNMLNTLDYTVKQNDYIDADNSTCFIFSIEKKFKKFPWKFKFESLQSYTKKEVLINSSSSMFSSIQNKFNLESISYFKSNQININLGFEYLVNNSSNSYNNSQNNLNKTTPFLKLYGIVFKDKMNWELTVKHIKYKSNNFIQKDILELNPTISYHCGNWAFSAKGMNILNINENNTRLLANNQESFFEETKFSSLSGFVTLGFSYSF